MLRLSATRATEIVAALRQEFGGELSRRVVALVDGCAHRVARPADRSAEQLWMPDLDSRPFWPPGIFDWTRRLEEAAPEIAAELAEACRRGPLELHLGEPDGEIITTSRAYVLRRAGRWRREPRRHCPAVAAILDTLPLSAGDVLCSYLEPGSKLAPHHGLSNLDLTCHLGLEVPPDCGLEVGGEARSWQAGRVLVFDDTFRHRAWNDGAEPRVILRFEVWNPELSEAEQRQLRHALPLLLRPAPRSAAIARDHVTAVGL